MAEAGGGGTVEVFADGRVGDGDEGAGTFGEAFAAEGGDAVFGNDVLDKVAGGDDAGAFSEDRVDLRATFFRHGRDGDEGLAAFRVHLRSGVGSHSCAAPCAIHGLATAFTALVADPRGRASAMAP